MHFLQLTVQLTKGIKLTTDITPHLMSSGSASVSPYPSFLPWLACFAFPVSKGVAEYSKPALAAEKKPTDSRSALKAEDTTLRAHRLVRDCMRSEKAGRPPRCRPNCSRISVGANAKLAGKGCKCVKVCLVPNNTIKVWHTVQELASLMS